MNVERPEKEERSGRTPAGRERPAVTVVIQSWATPIAGLLMLVVGLLAGYFGRPLIADRLAGSPQATSPQAASQPVAVGEPAATSALPAATAASTSELSQITSQAELMVYLVERTRHFKGDPNAPVVMLEFSDFQ